MSANKKPQSCPYDSFSAVREHVFWDDAKNYQKLEKFNKPNDSRLASKK
jgi:hypothetical protein